MPRRIGFLVEGIIDYDNLYDSIKYVLRGNRKKLKKGKYIWKHVDETIKRLQEDIAKDRFRLKNYIEDTVIERDKERKIQSVGMYQRIGLNAVMKVVEERLRNRLILNTAASLKGRGGHWLLRRLIKDLKKIPVEKRYIRKDDIRKFYESVPQDLAKKVIRHYIKDPIVINILDSCITMLPKGISIGLRSSQFLSMLILNYIIDHKLKDEKGVKYYYRYCDDGVEIEHNYKELTKDAQISHEAIENNGMEIKKNEKFWKHKDAPIDFLGYVIYSDGNIRIRKHIKQRFARRWKRVKSERRKQELLASFYGMCKHARAKHLFEKITNININAYGRKENRDSKIF